MILMEMELTAKVTWLDPEGSDQEKRKRTIIEDLAKLFSHEFGEIVTKKHGVKIELIRAK